MPTKKLSDEVLYETLKIYEANNRRVVDAAKSLNISHPTLLHRIKLALARFPKGIEELKAPSWTYPRLQIINKPNSRWIIGSDLHVWTETPPLIYQAFCKIAKQLKVTGIILNGDVIDGARISRHPNLRYSKAPKIDKEIEAAKKLLKMLPNAHYRLWTIGNHDIRIDNYIAQNASEMSDFIISLQEHFPIWKLAYAFEINGVEVRHRWRGGVHTAYTNTVQSGISMVTGHTHQLQVTAMRDRNGSRYGIECGMLADPLGPQFEYTEGQPNRWQPGFVVLSFDKEGQLMPPELCEMVRGRPVFRGSYVI